MLRSLKGSTMHLQTETYPSIALEGVSNTIQSGHGRKYPSEAFGTPLETFGNPLETFGNPL